MTGDSSPPVRSPTTRPSPWCSSWQCGLSGASAAARGAQERARQRAWRCGGAGRRGSGGSSHGEARGAADEVRGVKAEQMRSKTKRKRGGRRDVVGSPAQPRLRRGAGQLRRAMLSSRSHYLDEKEKREVRLDAAELARVLVGLWRERNDGNELGAGGNGTAKLLPLPGCCCCAAGEREGMGETNGSVGKRGRVSTRV